MIVKAGNLRKVAGYHIEHYARLASLGVCGQRGIVVDECHMYRDIWLDLQDSIRLADDEDDVETFDLCEAERSEVEEAFESGEFNELFGVVTPNKEDSRR